MPKRDLSPNLLQHRGQVGDGLEHQVASANLDHEGKRQRLDSQGLSTHSGGDGYGASSSSHAQAQPSTFEENGAEQTPRNVLPELVSESISSHASKAVSRPISQSGGDRDPRGSNPHAASMFKPPQTEEAQKRDARKAEIIRRSAQLDPPLRLAELELMSSFNAAIRISKPLDNTDWEFLHPRLLSERPEVQDTVHQNEAVVKSIKDQVQVQRDPLTTKTTKEAEAAAWEESQRPIREALERIAREYINHNWAGGEDVTHQTCTTFAVQILAHARQEFFEQITSNRPRLLLDAMKWLYEVVVKPIAEQYGKNLYACSRCDAPFKSFEGCIQHFAAKHTFTMSHGPAVVAWREVDWPEDLPFDTAPTKRRHVFQTTSPFLHKGHSATPLPSPSPWLQNTPSQPPTPSAYPPPVPTPNNYVISAVGTPAHDNVSFAPPPSGSPTRPYVWSVPPPLSHTPRYSPSPFGYGYRPPTQTLPPPPLGQSPIALSQPAYPAPPSQSASSLTQQGPDKLGQILNETWTLLCPLEGIDTSVLVYTVIQNAVFEFQTRHSAIPTLDMVKGTVDHEPQLGRLRDADKLDCKVCTRRLTAHLSINPSSVAPIQLYKFNAVLKHFKKAHEGKASWRGVDAGSNDSPATFDWKKDMISLPDDSQIARLSNSPNIDAKRLEVLSRVFPGLFGTPHQTTTSAAYMMNSDEYDPRNPEIIGPIKPENWHGGSQTQELEPSYGQSDGLTDQEQPEPPILVQVNNGFGNYTNQEASEDVPYKLDSPPPRNSPLPPPQHGRQNQEDRVAAADQFLLELEADHARRLAGYYTGQNHGARQPPY